MLAISRTLLTLALSVTLFAACGSTESGDGSDLAADSTSSTSTSTTATTVPSTTSTSATSSTSTSSTTTTTASSSTTEPAASCSASGLARPGPQVDLPKPVADKREAMIDAALACDIEALAALTGEPFTASFGGDEPLALWSDEEQGGAEPLRALVELLRLPSISQSASEGALLYLWPPAFGYDTWDEVPAYERRALSALYGPEDFAGFESFGGYIGYRIGITEDGTWTIFVAGD